jgi:hypothetical protein
MGLTEHPVLVAHLDLAEQTAQTAHLAFPDLAELMEQMERPDLAEYLAILESMALRGHPGLAVTAERTAQMVQAESVVLAASMGPMAQLAHLVFPGLAALTAATEQPEQAVFPGLAEQTALMAQPEHPDLAASAALVGCRGFQEPMAQMGQTALMARLAFRVIQA